MPCTHRVTVIYDPINKKLKFTGRAWTVTPDGHPGSVLDDKTKKVFGMNCGKCTFCRLQQAREKAIRCVHQTKEHDNAIFITLTYNDENLPQNETCNSDHPREFVKALRAKICREYGCRDSKSKTCLGYCPKIKTFGCQEYGPGKKRPHYHLLIFGYKFPDQKVFGQRGNDWSTTTWEVQGSKQAAELWGRGFIEIGEVTPSSAGYVARYTLKKLSGKKALLYQERKIEKEKAICISRGIGAEYVKKYAKELLFNKNLIFKGKKYQYQGITIKY